MLDVTEAERCIRDTLTVYPAEEVPISEAHGRVLREDVVAERDQPPFDRVTMDGIALSYALWSKGERRFRVEGVAPAGARIVTLGDPRHCIEVMTGCALPPGSDCVIPIEQVSISDGWATVAADAVVERGQNIHPRGSDGRGGERVLSQGIRIGAPEMAVLASAGKAQVMVGVVPSVVVMANGDELVDVDEPIAEHQIRRSNDYALAASLAAHGFARVARTLVRDDEGALEEALSTQLANNEVLVLCGGVSMGKYDYIPGVLTRLGVEVRFHKIRQRPGKPMWFGVGTERQAVFALPGNPVSALVCLHRYVIPGLLTAQGARDRDLEWVSLAESVDFRPDLTYFPAVKLVYDSGSSAQAVPVISNTSGDFLSLAGTDGFVQLERGRTHFPAGEMAPLFRWRT